MLIAGVDTYDRSSQDLHVECARTCLPALHCGFHGWWGGRSRIENSRLTTRKTEDSISNTKRRTGGIQAFDMEGAEENVVRRRLERLHERERHQLHTHHPIFSRSVWVLQHLQTSMWTLDRVLWPVRLINHSLLNQHPAQTFHLSEDYSAAVWQASHQ